MTDPTNPVSTQLQHLPDSVTIADVARVMQTTTRTVRRLVARGVLPPPLRFGRLRRRPRAVITEILAG